MMLLKDIVYTVLNIFSLCGLVGRMASNTSRETEALERVKESSCSSVFQLLFVSCGVCLCVVVSKRVNAHSRRREREGKKTQNKCVSVCVRYN